LHRRWSVLARVLSAIGGAARAATRAARASDAPNERAAVAAADACHRSDRPDEAALRIFSSVAGGIQRGFAGRRRGAGSDLQSALWRRQCHVALAARWRPAMAREENSDNLDIMSR